jgi:gamma-glutamyltranspeptidase / glutathione hydrolase
MYPPVFAPRRLLCFALAASLVLSFVARSDERAPDSALRDAQGVVGQSVAGQSVVGQAGMVVAQEGFAARVGADILQKGGNAVDAAVAVGFALAVTFPRAGNIGGGGFMVVHLADGNDTTIDYRETAPAGIHAKSFLDELGNADPGKSRDSALAVGVPGTVAGLALAEQKYGSGKFSLAELIAPAITLARDGIIVSEDAAAALINRRLSRWPASAKIFLKNDSAALGPGALSAGDRLVQADLGDTLQTIARDGPRAFYQGAIAEKIAAAVTSAGGVMTVDDLKNYQATERAPVRGSYRGYDVVSMAPPSSGGVGLIEMLNILEGYDLGNIARLDETNGQSALALHLMVEAMKRAYADRTLFLGDPDRVANPIALLTSKTYAAAWRAGIDPVHATAAADIRAGGTVQPEGRNTTHFSVIDRFGNAVANTYTLNFNFGVGLVAEGTGILLNNELDDFAAKPYVPNAFGLLGAEANAPGPGKRPLSSMTPTILLKDGKPFLITGSPGGSRIITAVLQVIVNVIDRGMDIAAAVAAPRLHDQWMPDQIYAEPGFADEVIAALQAGGDKVVRQLPFTSANSIMITPRGFVGAADPRSRDALAVGFSN